MQAPIRSILARSLALACTFAASAAWLPEIQPRFARQPEMQRSRPGPTGSGAKSATPGDADYWATRWTYPTGKFDVRWLLAAAEDHRALEAGVPAGAPSARSRGDGAAALDPFNFTSLGPQPLNGQNGWISAGRTNVIASDPANPAVAYFGSNGGGVWKTTTCCSAATTWSPVTDDPLLSTIAIGDLVLDPNDAETIYAGTGDLRYVSWSFGAAGLLKSTDAGATWSLLGADVFSGEYPQGSGLFPQYQAIGQVEVDPRDSDHIAVGTKTGLFFSYDAGVNWSGPCFTNPHATQRQDVTGLVVRDTGSATELIAAIGTRGFDTPVQPDLDLNGANGIYTATWPASGCPSPWTLRATGWPAGTGSGTPYPTNALGRIDLGISPSNPLVIYAQVAAIPTRGQLGVWRSADGGLTWTQQSDAADLTGCFGDYSQNWYDQGVSVDPNDPNVVFISTVDLFRSTNAGATFVNLTCGYAGGNVHVDHHARAFVGGNSAQLLVGSDGGLFYTANANAPTPTFIHLNSSISTIEFYSGDITAYFADHPTPGINGGAQDNGSSVKVWSGAPGPAAWVTTTGGDGMFARIEPVLGLRWYQESQNGNLRVSQTGPNGPYNGASGAWSGDRVSFIHPYEIDRYNCPGALCNHLIAGTQRVWETIQGAIPASSWYVNSGDLTKGTLADRSFINQLSYAVPEGSIALAGTNDGNVQYGFGLGQGVANSATWVDLTDGNLVLPNRPILDVATDPDVATVGYAAVGGFAANTPATPGHVFRVVCDSTCGSFTWEDKSGNLPDVPVDSILVNPHRPSQVFAGSDWGLYYTDDITVASPVWQRFANGLPPVMIWDLAIDRGFTTLAAFTRSRGAYVWPLPDADTALPFVDGFEIQTTGRWSATTP